MSQHLTNLWTLFEPTITGLGYELIEIEYHAHTKNGVLRLYIDSDTGIQIDDCTVVSEQISAILDVEDPISGRFSLEVSSPGADRPIRKLKDFEKYIGEVVKIKTGMAINGQRNFRGRMCAVENDQLLLDCDGRKVSLALAAIDRARLVPDYEEKNSGIH